MRRFRHTRSLTLLTVLVSGTLMVLLDAGDVRAQPAEERRGVTALVSSVAETIYAFAWPTAEYERFSLEAVQPVRGGYDVLVRFAGTSAFSGSSLWMDVAIEVREGRFHDLRVVTHNAILAPPFATVQAMGDLMQELAREYATSPREAGAVCLVNTTTIDITYSYGWEGGELQGDVLKAGSASWFWWPYDGTRRQSPRFFVRYDDNTAEGYTAQSYWLERRTVALPTTCDEAMGYEFYVGGGTIRLRAAN